MGDNQQVPKLANLIYEKSVDAYWLPLRFQICLQSVEMNQSSHNFRDTHLSIFSTHMQTFMQIGQVLFELETIT